MIPCVFTGLSIKRDDCTVCNELHWSTGELASDYQGFWGDSQPNDEDGDCVYLTRNQQDYVYDRPYVFYYGNCYRKLSFICERMAAPAGKTLIDATRCFELIALYLLILVTLDRSFQMESILYFRGAN